MTGIAAFAPAKINLFLHVGALRDDGYHPLTSWMVFADVGDRLTLTPAANYDLRCIGPFGERVPSDGGNLVVRARDALLLRATAPASPFTLTLEKVLPPASGMGGGSSDAAATLRLVGDRLGLGRAEQMEVARSLGSDVPACLEARSLMAAGRGEELTSAPQTPALPAVLVNPGVEVSTGQIFRAFDSGEPGSLDVDATIDRFASVTDVVEFLRQQRNDLQPYAVALQPVIGDALAQLAEGREALLVRMTGSGATVFALCGSDRDAVALADRIRVHRPSWWCAACRLG